MTARAEDPRQQLLASGLHRLAQPVSAALWALELAKEPTAGPLLQLAAEMRRAASILHALRGVMEAGATYQDARPECVNDLIAQVHDQVEPELRKGGIVCQPLESRLRVCCELDARGFAVAYRVLLEKFLLLGAMPATVRESLTAKGGEFVLTLECDSPVIGMWTEAHRGQIFRELDPFEIRGFDFSSNMAPELTQARAILGASGILLTGDLEGCVMRFHMQGRQSID